MEHTHKAQAHLKEHEAGHYRMLFNNMLSGSAHCEMIYDGVGNPIDFTYLEVNPAFEKLTGLNDVVGKRVTEVIPGVREANPELFETYGRVASTGTPEKIEIYLGPLKMWFTASIYSLEKGFFTAVFDNITEQKVREVKLREAMNEIQNLMRHIPEVLYVLDTKNNIIKWNRKAELASGYSAEELSHKLIFELLPERDRPSVVSAVNDAYLKGYAEVRAHLVKKDGTTIPYRWSAAPLNDEKGNDIGVIGIGWDLREQVIFEEKARAYEVQQRVCLDNIPDAVWMKNAAGEYLAANAAFLANAGKQRDEVLGKTDRDIFPKEYADKYMADDKDVMAGRLQKRMEETTQDPNGNVLHLETIKTPVYDETGKLIGITGIAREIPKIVCP
ncbi:hypothetical protein A2524_01455 [Candidatus Wolfebacteria bacterium RIFOXYD12_FULL_48_21]|uniref:PAS domain-containing protein n=1 Tax=Candidatus Wolfebacteria bacterium RIFOXYD1_FULL_48_65 TaxID=1802561 RepID=A0A1F8E442_9BACT|nr:MAG: hypothetical protein A2524_01455 [Candidatus Wolfebacteria bacterium RIFOXYD12_FULL_48_21]OGM95604.1 MAG: hypothetical protein A2610_00695 [Candidatus Wolfebacteria bacterium RIFOXYD1_FULL_48_65]